MEGETFELSIDPFADEPPEETGQKRSAKAPLQHEVPAKETGQKRSHKPPPRQSQQAGEKRSTKRPPQEGVRLEAAEKSSRKKSPIMQETSTQAGEQSSTKRPPQGEGVRLEVTEKSSRKGPPDQRLQEAHKLKKAEKRLRAVEKSSCKKSPIMQETSTLAGEQSSTKRLPQGEGVRLEAMEKSSRKGPPDQRLQEAHELKKAEKRLRKQPALVLQAAHKSSSEVQETSKQSSRRRRFITEEDDKMFSCNVDPFSAELVDGFEAHVENEEAESEQSSQENCF